MEPVGGGGDGEEVVEVGRRGERMGGGGGGRRIIRVVSASQLGEKGVNPGDEVGGVVVDGVGGEMGDDVGGGADHGGLEALEALGYMAEVG